MLNPKACMEAARGRWVVVPRRRVTSRRAWVAVTREEVRSMHSVGVRWLLRMRCRTLWTATVVFPVPGAP